MFSQTCCLRLALSLAICSLATWQPVAAQGTATAAPLNQLSAQEKADGWKLLFDGKTTDGWRSYRADTINSNWKVVDGALVRTGNGAGDIITDDKYGAFELKIQFKISPSGNSGIMYHVTEDGEVSYHTGPEVQIIDNAKKEWKIKAGWLYELYSADVDTCKPAGEWNEFHLLVSPKKCVHTMNGTKYCEYVKGSDDWNARVAASKFSKWKNFGKAEAGHICLQDHGNDVAFRDIKVRELPTE